MLKKLHEIAVTQNDQLIIATHSQTILNESRPEQMLSFYKKPHRLNSDFESNQVQSALKA
jgi:predicted ATPase